MGDYKTGMILSALFHGGLLLLGTVGLPALFRDVPDSPEPVTVEIVQIDEQDRTREEQEARQAETPSVQPEETQPVTRQAEAVPEDAVPLPDAEPREKPEQPREEARPPAPNVTPRTKPRPPSLLDQQRLAALIDRAAEEAPPQPEEVKDEEAETAKRARAESIAARQATARLQTVIQRKVEPCWSVPAGAKEAEDLLIRLRIFLTPDGRLARPPQFMDQDRMSDEFYRAAAESAARAIRLCAPYDLPQDQYVLWREIDFYFDPGEMLGG